MQGEFRGDFTRDTYTPQKQFLRVLMQQGRVQLDADFNEQVSILLHYLQTLATDLIGPYGVPTGAAGFAIAPELNGGNLTNLTISAGRYYLDGLLCENAAATDFENQPYNPHPDNYDFPDLPFLVYLDVWEQHIDSIQDADPNGSSIREVALGGSDTATRSKLVWQVKHTTDLIDNDDIDLRRVLNPDQEPAENPDRATIFNLVKQAADRLKTDPTLLAKLLGQADQTPPTLKARADKGSVANPNDPCLVSPHSRYRGAENQLYRVEIHSGGDEPTFKWSRENSAVVFPITNASGSVVTLEHLGIDSRFGLHENDWVEVIDDTALYRNEPAPLLQIKSIDLVTLQVTLSGSVGDIGTDAKRHPYLRRWDHRAGNPSYGGSAIAANGAVKLTLGTETWHTLENGVQVQFGAGTYRPGDYWLIPARTATGDVEWPTVKPNPQTTEPAALPPHGVKHYYAPLAIIAEADNENGNNIIQAVDCRHRFAPSAEAPV